MSLSCECDIADVPEFHRVKFHTARKEYKCCECGGAINPGDTYEREAMKWEGDFMENIRCEPCSDLAASLSALGFCWDIGDLRWAHQEYLREYQPPKLSDGAVSR